MNEKSANFGRILCLFILGIVFSLFVAIHGLRAEDYTGANFIVRDPVIVEGGGMSTSTGFQLLGSQAGGIFGESTSTNFSGRFGFLYYPVVVATPVVSATPGNGQAALSWTAGEAALGWSVSAYEVGKATASGGPYTFANASTNLSYTQTGLSNGTTYFFVVRVLNAVGDSITTSTEVSAAPVAPAPAASCGDHTCNGGETCSSCSADCGTCPSGGGGGGGGGGVPVYIPPPVPIVETAAIFSGKAYPKSTVTLLKDAQIVATTVAGSDANFLMKVSGLSAGNYIFSIYSEDDKGRRSSLLTFPVGITSGATTNVSGIFIAPTISTDKSEIKRGDDITIMGQSAPQADIVITINSDEEYFAKTIADKSGLYSYIFDTSPLELGEHYTKSKALISNMLASGYSSAINFKVGTKTTDREEIIGINKCGRADLDCNGKIDLVDFSIASYWYKRALSAGFGIIEKERLNDDHKINLIDFSIMAYYWTG